MIRDHHQFMVTFSKSFIMGLRRPVMAYLTTLSFTLMAAASSFFYWFEFGTNPKVETYFDAFYYTVTIMTGVGLGDIVPITTSARVLSIFMMLAGTGIFVCFVAVLSALILEIEMRNYPDQVQKSSDKAKA